MKKTLLLPAIAAFAGVLGLTSCSQEESVNLQGTGNGKIAFRPAMGTRATETTNANLTELQAAAFMGDQAFFPDMAFTKGEDGFFTSSPEYNWPGDDTELTFYTYSPAAPGGTVTLTSDTKKMTGFTVNPSIADQVDFVTANATGKKSVNEASGVELTFDHRLAEIEVLAKTDNTAYTYKVTGVRIGQPVSTGDFDFTTNAWTLGSDKAIYDETYDTPRQLGSTPISVMGEGGDAILLPQQLTAWDPENDGANSAEGAYLSIKLQINTTAGAQVYPFPSNGDCQWAAIPISTNWEAGKKYIYTLDLTHGAGHVDPHDPVPGTPVLGGPIKFTVQVTDFVDTPVNTPMTTK